MRLRLGVCPGLGLPRGVRRGGLAGRVRVGGWRGIGGAGAGAWRAGVPSASVGASASAAEASRAASVSRSPAPRTGPPTLRTGPSAVRSGSVPPCFAGSSPFHNPMRRELYPAPAP